MAELLNNPYFVFLISFLIFALIYTFFRQESIPGFLFLFFAGMGAFFEAAHIQKIAFLKAAILFMLLCALLIKKIFHSEKVPIGNVFLILLLISAVIISSWINEAGFELTRAYIGTLIIALVVALSPGKEKTMKYLIISMAIWGVINLGAAISQWAGHGWGYKSTSAIHTGERPEGLMGTSTTLGIYFVIALSAIHVLYFQAKAKAIRVLLFFIGVGLAIGLLGTLSRAAFLAWVVSFLFIQYLLSGMRLGSIIGIALFIAVLGGLASLLNLGGLFIERFSVIRKDPSALDRLTLFKMALQYTYKSLFFGVGLSQGGLTEKNLILNTHNTYLQRLMENGIIGFSIFLILLFRSIWEFSRRIFTGLKEKRANYHVGLLAALIGILVMGVFHDFSYLMSLWLVLGIGLMNWKYEEHGAR